METTKQVDFGSVLVGQMQTQTIQVYNKNDYPCTLDVFSIREDISIESQSNYISPKDIGMVVIGWKPQKTGRLLGYVSINLTAVP